MTRVKRPRAKAVWPRAFCLTDSVVSFPAHSAPRQRIYIGWQFSYYEQGFVYQGSFLQFRVEVRVHGCRALPD